MMTGLRPGVVGRVPTRRGVCVVRRSVGYVVTKVVVVCGPPGSGKSTYVAEHRKPHDIAVDLDALMAAISGRDWYDESPAHLTFAMAARDGIFNRLEQASGVPTAWIVMSEIGR